MRNTVFILGLRKLQVIYGILYVAVAIFEPIWSFLFKKPEGCRGVECYRAYTRSGLSLII